MQCVWKFQIRDSPHIHSFIWIFNAPILTKSTKLEYATWNENGTRVDLLDPKTESELWGLAKTYNIHMHSKKCRKYQNERYRFHYSKFFTS